jgi:hypothetical protein
MAIWPAIGGVGLRQRGWRQQEQEVPTVIGEVGAVVGTSWGDDSSSKDDASKGGGVVVVEPRSKIPQQPGKPAKKMKIPLGNLQ